MQVGRDVLYEFHLKLVFQLEVYYKADRLLTGLTAQPKGTTARWYSNKTSLVLVKLYINMKMNCEFIKTNFSGLPVHQLLCDK